MSLSKLNYNYNHKASDHEDIVLQKANRGDNGITDIKSISKLVTPIAQKYGADRVVLFGSRVKNTATETSDYDFIISKGKIQSLFQLASFIDELEKVFERKVDVITDTSNDIVFLEQIKRDEVVIYESKR